MAGEFKLRITEIKQALNPVKMAKDAYRVFGANTPIRTGNARRNTHLFQDTIEADYPYAQRLDEGYSKQRPNGMTKPTLEFLKNYVRKQGS
jgi:hypothetical protein